MYSVYSVQCTVYSVHCTGHSVLCTVYSVRYIIVMRRYFKEQTVPVALITQQDVIGRHYIGA